MATSIHKIISASLCILILNTGQLFAQSPKLFEGDNIISMRISGDLQDLLDDRTGKAEYRPINLSYFSGEADEITMPIRARTRGHFRRIKGNCSHPPILLRFSRSVREGTIFEEQRRMKLVLPCKGDKYVLREYYVYKLYNLITPNSFRAQLVKIELDDEVLKPRLRGPFYGILLEEEDQMAARNSSISIERRLIRPEHTDSTHFLKMAVFQYLIGNTDWSIQYRQNIKLIAADSLSSVIPVPYDFDHAGIVRAPYAKPAPELNLNTTRERRYRGYCIEDMVRFEEVFQHFKENKEGFYSLFTNSEFLDQNYIQFTIRYLDDFYKTLNDPIKARKEFQYPCDKDGTGHIIIKGLRN
ncbi:MAG: hypothetical protein ACXIUQ_03050 [Cecembia sp.]